MKAYVVSIIIFFSLLLSFSCKGRQNKGKVNELLDFYIGLKNRFPTEYSSHFPEEVNIDSSFYYSYSELEEWGIILSCSITEKPTIDHLITQSKFVYPADDSCQLIINRFFTEDRYNVILSAKDSSQIDRLCYLEKLPVPNFRRNIFSVGTSPSVLTSDFTLYVLGAEQGVFFQPEDKYPPNKYMPKAWKHGYSKGVAVSEEKGVAIYWIMIW